MEDNDTPVRQIGCGDLRTLAIRITELSVTNGLRLAEKVNITITPDGMVHIG